jgi:hypothetical protein
MKDEEIKTMSAARVAKALAEHNKWRRGEGKYSKACSLSPHEPHELGAIIDRAVELLKEKSNDGSNGRRDMYNGSADSSVGDINNHILD